MVNAQHELHLLSGADEQVRQLRLKTTADSLQSQKAINSSAEKAATQESYFLSVLCI